MVNLVVTLYAKILDFIYFNHSLSWGIIRPVAKKYQSLVDSVIFFITFVIRIPKTKRI